MTAKKPNRKRQGANRIEAGAYFGVDPQTIDDWGEKKWLVRFPDRSIDLASTAVRVDTMRDPFVGGKPDRGVEPKTVPLAGADGQARARARAIGQNLTPSERKARGEFRTRIAPRRRGNEHMPQDIESPVILERWPRQRSIRLATTEGAAAAVGDIAPDIELFGLTKGQFSAPEILHTLLRQTGPADVVVCTWTINTESVARLAEMREAGELSSVRLILDGSLKGREPEYCAHLIAILGNENIRTTRNHAKWMLIRNAEWNLAVRMSMNFSTDPRLEYFEVSDDAAFCDFFQALTDELWQRSPAFNFEGDGSGLAFESAAFDGAHVDAAALSERRLSIGEAADHFGVAKASISRARNAGWLTFDDDGCAPVARLDAEWQAKNAALVVKPIQLAEASPIDGHIDYAEARRLREVAEAGIAQMKEAQMRGDLIRREDAERVFCDSIAKAKANLEAIPNRCAELLVGQTDAAVVRQMLTREIEGALAVVSGEVPNV